MSDFEHLIFEAVEAAVKQVYDIDAKDVIVVETPRDPKMGDYSTSVAMRLAKQLHKRPSDIAAPIVEVLKETFPQAKSIEIANPGFINFRISEDSLTQVINRVLEERDSYGHNDSGKGKKVLVEWVSANPTGDLHCGHARNAAWGDSICRLMEASGYDVLREYYINDAGNQVNMLGESLISRYFEFFGMEYPLPEDGYHAADVKHIAEDVKRELAKIERDLAMYGVKMDSWMHETFFYENDSKRIKDCLARMNEMGLTYEKDGALWFRSTDYGDDKDRVLRKSDGSLSYLTPDIANHVYKVERGYPNLVDLWGADHHSYVIRMNAALRALGYPEGTLSVDLIQMVRMVENGEEVKMSKRTGNAITIRELCEDVGVDAARWFFVSKDVASHMDFDMDLARKKDNNNPVFYCQYAYSRMHSILEKAQAFEQKESYDRLTDEKELLILKMIGDFPNHVAEAAASRKPNKITDYVLSLVKIYHSYYNSCRVINPEDPDLTNQRLGLVKATGITLKNALALLGVSAPEHM